MELYKGGSVPTWTLRIKPSLFIEVLTLSLPFKWSLYQLTLLEPERQEEKGYQLSLSPAALVFWMPLAKCEGTKGSPQSRWCHDTLLPKLDSSSEEVETWWQSDQQPNAPWAKPAPHLVTEVQSWFHWPSLCGCSPETTQSRFCLNLWLSTRVNPKGSPWFPESLWLLPPDPGFAPHSPQIKYWFTPWGKVHFAKF